jgi:outer membrane protein TolC
LAPGCSVRGFRQSYLQQETLPVMTLGSVLGQMSYQIDLFGRIRRGVEAARADEEGAHATLEAARTSLAAQVAYAYLAQCASAEALELAEANLMCSAARWKVRASCWKRARSRWPK